MFGMTHPLSFSQAEFADKKKTTRREKFLARMEEIIPWQNLVAVIAPFYPKGERGRPPVGLERMLRMYFLPQWYGLTDEALEDAINADLSARGLMMREGTLVDATLIAAPPSTKNKGKKRDPEMHQTRKGNPWYFGMKAHIGADRDSKLVQAVVVTAANVSDIAKTGHQLHVLFGLANLVIAARKVTA
jgi:IS5 family transposase